MPDAAIQTHRGSKLEFVALKRTRFNLLVDHPTGNNTITDQTHNEHIIAVHAPQVIAHVPRAAQRSNVWIRRPRNHFGAFLVVPDPANILSHVLISHIGRRRICRRRMPILQVLQQDPGMLNHQTPLLLLPRPLSRLAASQIRNEALDLFHRLELSLARSAGQVFGRPRPSVLLR